jgi:hypothetical protein
MSTNFVPARCAAVRLLTTGAAWTDATAPTHAKATINDLRNIMAAGRGAFIRGETELPTWQKQTK